MLKITNRTAKIGNGINSRAEPHGEDSVTAIDIPLTGVMLDEGELNALLNEPHAHAALFNYRRKGPAHMREPMFPQLHAFGLKDKIEGATVTIVTDLIGRQGVVLRDVKVAKIKLEPQLGGLTSMSCTIQSTPDIDDELTRLFEYLNGTVEVSIDGGQYGAQQPLPLVQVASSEEEKQQSEDEVHPEVVAAFNEASEPLTDQQIAQQLQEGYNPKAQEWPEDELPGQQLAQPEPPPKRRRPGNSKALR